MNAKLNRLTLAISVGALVLASLGLTLSLTQAAPGASGALEPQAGALSELARTTETLQVRVNDLVRENAELREKVTTTHVRLMDVESGHVSTEDQL